MMVEKYDILIIGGGLVGASLVCALEPTIKAHNLKVGLVESHDLSEPRDAPPSYDERASALSYGTRCIYDQLGLWPLLKVDATPILDIHVSDQGHFGATHLNHHNEHVPAFGYVIENYRLGDVLLKRLKAFQQQKLIDVVSPAEVTALTPLPDAMMSVKVLSENIESTIEVSLVVLADGGRSPLLDQLHVLRKQYDYQQHALVANVSLDKPHNGVAYERFAGDGPMALLPLTEDRCGLVWTLPSEHIKEYLALNDQDFLELLQNHFGYRAGRFIRIGQRNSYPLSLNVAREQVRPGLVILGNAAHSMHPVAGQGYNLAIRDTMALAKNIEQSVIAGTTPGNLTRLLDYVNTQKRDQSMTLDFCDHLVKLFARKETGVILARNLGLAGLNTIGSLKSKFARKAMGL